MFSKNDTETNQVSNYLDNTLNSNSPITPKILQNSRYLWF